jgi:hypothetical protein
MIKRRQENALYDAHDSRSLPQPIPSDFMPDMEAIKKMGKYNEELQKAGVLLGLDGLTPPSAGARVSFSGGKAKVTDGPFAEAKEAIGAIG